MRPDLEVLMLGNWSDCACDPGYDSYTCLQCDAKAKLFPLGIGLALAGLAAQLVAEEAEWTSGYVDTDEINAHFAARAGIVLP